jgi:hypothetical protein
MSSHPTHTVSNRRHRPSLRAIAAATVLSIGVVGGAFVAPADAASANGGIYVVTPAWWGNCSSSLAGGVHGLATVNSYVGHSNGGDYGDDIAWMPVRLNTSQSVQIKVVCKRGGAAMGSNISATIRPTCNGQTFYFGANSAFASN